MIYFVTKQDLEDNLPISGNADVNDYYFNVKTSADMFTRSILGTYFYNDLLVKYNAQTMNGDELNLLSYIQMAIAWRTASESVITLSYQLKNKGIQTQSGDFSSNAEYKDLMFLVHHYSDKASFYDNRLFTYLVDNKDLYPVFLDNLNNDSTAKKSACNGSNNNFNSNILFI
jgi:hypothetical protein